MSLMISSLMMEWQWTEVEYILSLLPTGIHCLSSRGRGGGCKCRMVWKDWKHLESQESFFPLLARGRGHKGGYL